MHVEGFFAGADEVSIVESEAKPFDLIEEMVSGFNARANRTDVRLNGVHNPSLTRHTNAPSRFLDGQCEVRARIAVVYSRQARHVITLNCCAKLKSLREHLPVVSANVGIGIVRRRLRWFRADLKKNIRGQNLRNSKVTFHAANEIGARSH